MSALNAIPTHRTVHFHVPAARAATRPPEYRGRSRDDVKLLVATPGRILHRRFPDLADLLRAGDLVVVNSSATEPAAIDALRGDGTSVAVHVAGPHPDEDGSWVIELRHPDARGPMTDGHPGERILATGGLDLVLDRPYPHGPGPDRSSEVRLWRATATAGIQLRDHLERHGRPIAYGYLAGRWPRSSYRTVVAQRTSDFGSAEMASAGRPFTRALIARLLGRGIRMASVVLHSGVSSPEAGEPPTPERFEVPDMTARLVTSTHQRGGRVIAVGTTVTRALETVANEHGTVRPDRGWTDLVLGSDRPARLVDGLLTGWHTPEASHLDLLLAVAGVPLVQQAYDAALANDYRWHEFGDSCLLLPADPGGRS